MQQAQARKRARELSMETGHVMVADTVRPGKDGWTRGGWPSLDQTWAVINYETGEILEVDEPKT